MPIAAAKHWQLNPIKAAKADPKKATALAVLITFMVFMWVRILGGSSAGPATASANVADPQPPAASDNSVRSNPRLSAMYEALREWASRPVSPLSRNLFAVNYDFFPQDGSRPVVLRAPQGDGFWDRLAKSMTARADAKREQEVLRENLRLQAAQLKIQSTVMGVAPKALINGELVGEGDTVASFRISRIEARRVVVEREGIKLELRLN
jgi:hypothetical protein